MFELSAITPVIGNQDPSILPFNGFVIVSSLLITFPKMNLNLLNVRLRRIVENALQAGDLPIINYPKERRLGPLEEVVEVLG